MVVNTRDRNTDSSRREDSRKGQIDRCEIINVRPHVKPYPEDKDFNTVDVQLVDRPLQEDGTFATIERIRINSIQREHGLFQGNPWHPRIGDLVLIYWISEKEAMVLCSITSVEQEPVCRSLANQNHQEYVHKLAAWRAPIQCATTKNFVAFPPPEHPDCFKWWPVQADGKTPCLDSIWIFDCLEGHNTPSCCAEAPCNGLDDHQSSTCIKNFSQFSQTEIDKPWRFKVLHHCGSNLYFDEDGCVNLENQVAHDLYNRAALYPPSGYSDEHGPIAFEMVNIKTMALVRGYHDGCVRIRASVDPTGNSAKSEVFLGADGHCWLWNAVADAYVEIFPDGQVKIKSPRVVLEGSLEVTGDLTVNGLFSAPLSGEVGE